MFISVKMIEPATASVAVYLLSKTNRINPYVLKKRPFHYKRKLCKWICKNKHTIIDVGMDEFADCIFDISNNIHIPSPTIAITLYWLLILIFMFL
jgi:hypothetical protein